MCTDSWCLALKLPHWDRKGSGCKGHFEEVEVVVELGMSKIINCLNIEKWNSELLVKNVHVFKTELPYI